MTLFASYTADEVIAAIGRALKAEDMPGVARLLRVLAVKDPDSAQTILDTIALLNAKEVPGA